MSPVSSRAPTRGSARTGASPGGGGPPSRAPRAPGGGARPVRRRRRGVALAAALLIGGGAAIWGFGLLDDAVREVTLPLRHEDVIRQQAEEKDLDPALIAAIIYEESRFRPRTSPAGAEGLMQITPETATFIAERSGATRFELRDLDTPQINIAYGSFYLRELIDRYDGDEDLAVAAYNAGGTNVNRWIVEAGGVDDFDIPEDIGFPETRAYVENVAERRKEYEKNRAEELGL